VDLFGPFTINDTVKGRTHGKAYGVLFNCMSSRAVYVDLAEGYDTSHFSFRLRQTMHCLLISFTVLRIPGIQNLRLTFANVTSIPA
jgi:hypothetical protein